jgi:hypothetical protein
MGVNGTWVDSFLNKRNKYLIVPKGLVIVLNYSKYKVIWSGCVIKQVVFIYMFYTILKCRLTKKPM